MNRKKYIIANTQEYLSNHELVFMPETIVVDDDVITAKNKECTVTVDIKKLLGNETIKDQGKWLFHEITLQLLSQINYKVRSDSIYLQDYLESKFEGSAFAVKIRQKNNSFYYTLIRDGLLILDNKAIDIYKLNYTQLNKATLESNETAILQYCKRAVSDTYEAIRSDSNNIYSYLKMAIRIPEYNYQTQALLFSQKPDLLNVNPIDFYEKHNINIRPTAKPLYILNENNEIDMKVCPVYDLADTNAQSIKHGVEFDEYLIEDYLTDLGLSVDDANWARNIDILSQHLGIDEKDKNVFSVLFEMKYGVKLDTKASMLLNQNNVSSLLQSINRMSKKISEFDIAMKQYQTESVENLHETDSFAL